MKNSNKEIVRAFFERDYELHDYSGVMGLAAENYVDHSPAGARSNTDAVGIRKAVEEMFSNLKIGVLDLFETLENFKVENGRSVESRGDWPDLEIQNKLG